MILAVQERNIQSTDLADKYFEDKSYEKAGAALKGDTKFHDKDGNIDWSNVWSDKEGVLHEFWEQAPNTLVALLSGPSGGGAASTVFSIPSRLFFWSQMHNEYMDNATQNYLDDQYGQGNWSNKEYADFVSSPDWNQLRNESLASSSITSQFDRWSDKFPFAKGAIGGKIGEKLVKEKTRFAFRKAIEKLSGNVVFNLLKTGTKIGTSSWVEGQTELLQETIGEGLSERLKSDWDQGILEVTKKWYTDRDSLTDEQRDKFAASKALGTLIGGAFGGAGASSSYIGNKIGRKFNIDMLKNLTIAEEFAIKPEKFAFLDKESFNSYMENAKYKSEQAYNDPLLSNKKRLDARGKLVNLLSFQTAYNEASDFKLNEKGQKKAISLIQERNDLKQRIEATGGSGLSTNMKERVKQIDEQLQKIETQDKVKHLDSLYERIRKKIGPRRSVGAARASNTPQKILDSVNDLFTAADNKIDAFNRLEEVIKEEANLSPEEASEVKAEYENEYDAFKKSGFSSFNEYLASKDTQQEQNLEGVPDDKIASGVAQSVTKSQETQSEKRSVNNSIDVLFSPTKGPIIKGESVNQETKNEENSKDVKNADLRNKTWEHPRTKEDASTAGSALKQMTPGQKELPVSKSLQDFVDYKNYVHSLIEKFLNEKVDSELGGAGQWDRLQEEAKALDTLAKNSTDSKEKKAANKKLKSVLANIDKLWNVGVFEIDLRVGRRIAANNEIPPPYYNAAKGRFEVVYDNKFGNSLIYDLFPDNGEAIFNGLPIREYSKLMVRFAEWQSKEGRSKEGAKKKLEKYAEELHNKYKNELPSKGVKVDEKLERDKTRAGFQTIKKQGGTVIKDKAQSPEDVDTTAKNEEYTDTDKDNATIRWSSMSKDLKTSLEGDLIYQIMALGSSPDSKAVESLLGQYSQLVGTYQAVGFINSLQSVEFGVSNNATPELAKIELLRQLWKDQTISGPSKAISTETYIATLPSSDQEVAITVTKQRIADLSSVLDAMEDGPKKEETRSRIAELRKLLNKQQSDETIAKQLPTFNSVLTTDGNPDYAGANMVSFASLVILGEQTGVSPEVLESLAIEGVPANLSEEQLINTVSRFELSTKAISDIIEQQAQISAEIRSRSIYQPSTNALTSSDMNAIETLASQSKQLENKKQALMKDREVAAQIIASVELGKSKVEGLEGSIRDLKQSTTLGGPKITPNKQVAKEIALADKLLESLNEKIEVIKKQLADPNLSLSQKAHLEIELNILDNKHSLTGFDRDSLVGLTNMDTSQMDLTTKLPEALLSLSDSEIKALEVEKTEAAEAVEELGDILRRGRLNLTEAHKAKVLLGIPIEDVIDSIVYATHKLQEEGFPTTTQFIVNLGGALPIQFPKDATSEEKKTIRAYAGSFLLSTLEEEGIMDLKEPEFHKDSWKIEIIDEKFVNKVSKGVDLATASGKLAKRIRLDEQKWNQTQFNKPPQWESHQHKFGFPMDKRRTTDNQMSLEEYPKVYEVLNNAQENSMSIDQELNNVFKHLVNLKHAAFDFTNKSYSQKQRDAKIRERDSIMAKADEIGDRPYFNLYKFGSRGRLYSVSPYLNHQADKKAKALIQMGDAKPIGTKGWKWLLSDLAEQAGAKKDSNGNGVVTLQELHNYSYENLNEWIKWAANPIKYKNEIFGDENGQGGMDEPELWLSAALEVRNALAHGDPTTYPSKYVGYIDASVSGIQVIGSLLRDASVLEWVNLMPGKLKKDLYVKVFEDVIGAKGILHNVATDEQLRIFSEVNEQLKDFDNQIKAIKDRDSKEFQTEVKAAEEAKKAELEKQGKKAGKKQFELTRKETKAIRDRLSKKFEVPDKKDTTKFTSEVGYIQKQKKLYWDTVDQDTYNGVFWGQQKWIERGRKAGKGPVMTTTYGAAISGMSEALFDVFSIEKDSEGKSEAIFKENTTWLAKNIVAQMKINLPSINNIKKELVSSVIELAEDGKDFGAKGLITDFNWQNRYRGVKETRVEHNYKGSKKFDTNETGDISLAITIGNEEDMRLYDENDKKTDEFKDAISGILANFTHSFDKEIVADMMLTFGKDNGLLTIHDAFGSHLNSMDGMFDAVRNTHEKMFSQDALYKAFADNFSPEVAKEKTDKLMVNTWKPEYSHHNQNAYGQSGKADPQKITDGLMSRLAEKGGDTTKQPERSVETSDGHTDIVYKDGNVSLTEARQQQNELKKLAYEKIDENIHEDNLKVLNKDWSSRLFKMRSVEGVETIADALIGIDDEIHYVIQDIKAGEASLNEMEEILDRLDSLLLDAKATKNKTVKSLVSAIIGANNLYYSNFLLEGRETKKAKFNALKALENRINNAKPAEKVEVLEEGPDKHLPENDSKEDDQTTVCNVKT